MAHPLDALRSLTTGTGGLVDSRLLQQTRLREMQRNRELNPRGSGATASDISNLQADLNMDPMMGTEAQARVRNIENQNEEFQDYDRPEAVAIRDQQKQDALEKLLAPIQMRGQYDVEAAKQSQIGRNQQNEASIRGRADVVRAQQEGMTGRTERTTRSREAQMRLKQLLDEKKAGYGAMDYLGGGAKRQAADDEIARLVQELQSPDGDESEMGGPVSNTGTHVPNTGAQQPETAAEKLRRFSQ